MKSFAVTFRKLEEKIIHAMKLLWLRILLSLRPSTLFRWLMATNFEVHWNIEFETFGLINHQKKKKIYSIIILLLQKVIFN
jgi:hypothetical protein